MGVNTYNFDREQFLADTGNHKGYFMLSQSSPFQKLPLWQLLSAVTVLLFFPAGSFGQTAVTGWTLSNSDAANSTAYSPTITFQNQTSAVTSITAGATMTIGSTATAAFVRRNTDSNGNGTPNGAGDNNNRSSVWEVTGTSTTNVLGTNPSAQTLNNVLLGNNVLMGTNDLFSNGNTQPWMSNVERVDFYWAGGFTAVSTEGFAVFERGNAGSHDQFNIAVFTAVDAAGTPTAYSGNVVSATATDYGSNLNSFTNYQILRFNAGDSLSTLDTNTTGGDSAPGVAGVFISFADLGIAAGTKVYGYSLMANDTTTVVTNLVDWTNTASYRVDTPDAPGSTPNGSIDLLGFNGRRFVPEPATYGAILLFFTVGVVAVRRRQLAVPVRVEVRR